MAPERRRAFVLGGLLAVSVLIGLLQVWSSSDAPSGVGPTEGGRPASPSGAVATLTAPDVRLQELDAERPTPQSDLSRDLFRFEERRVRQADVPQAVPAPRVAAPPQVPSGSPQPLPIALRFIGLVESADPARKIAILSDGRGVYQGREGDIIEGRYRILRIGAESVEMAYLDGRGRQIIRLAGS